MDFFRHNYSTETDYFNRWTSDFDNMGFVQYDGTSLLDLSDPSQYPYMKWKYESLTNYETYGHPFFKNHGSGGAAFLQFYQYYGGSNYYNWSEVVAYIYGVSNVVFFIPLKNKGFLYRLQTKDDSTIIQPFLPFLSPTIGTGSRHWAEFIGFQSNISSISPYSYITLAAEVSYQQTENSNIQYYEDLQKFPTASNSSNYNHRIWIDGTTRYLNFIDGANKYISKEGGIASNSTWKPLLTVDVNQNVCTLMHVPYDNTYLDNIYLLVTAPQEDMDSKFFSFGGRNFLNLGTNIVVELPAN